MAPNEPARLRTLYRYQILDTPVEDAFDQIVFLATRVGDAPAGFIGFLDDSRLWLKASVGMKAAAIPRSQIVCPFNSRGEAEMTVISDTSTEGRGAPLKADIYPPKTSFYAAFPIITPDNHTLGVLAILDFKSRTLDSGESKALQALAYQTAVLLELRRIEAEREQLLLTRQSLRSLNQRELSLIQYLIDQLPDFIYIKNTDGRYVIDNAAHRRLIGANSPEDVLGKTTDYFFPRKMAARYLHDDRKVMDSGTVQIARTEPVVDASGQTHQIATTKIPLYDSQGVVEGLLCIGRDVTFFKQTENALTQERHLLHTLMDTIPDNIYFKDREGRFIRVNNSMAQWFGLNDPMEAVGKNDFDFFSTEHAQQAFEDEQEILRTGVPLVGKEEKETWPDGSITWVSTTKEPLRDENGQVIGTFGISRDITALKNATLEIAERDRRNREDMKVARAIHNAMLPLEPPIFPGLEFGLRFVPSGDIGGDFIDFVNVADPDSLGIVFADITGHGVAAALLASMFKVLVEDAIHDNLTLTESFFYLNERLYKQYPVGNFASAFYATFNVRQRVMTYVKASQEPLIILRPGERTQLLTNGGPALGLLAGDCIEPEEYQQHEIQLQTGDIVFFFTDGLTEFYDGKQSISIQREQLIAWLEEALAKTPQEIVDHVYQRAMDYAGVNHPTDDIAALAVRISG